MAGTDKRKQSLYFPESMLQEIQAEAARQDRSLSWIVQKAWKIARKEIMKYPSVNDYTGEDTGEDERGRDEAEAGE
ncbi:MAG: TIGR04563 family protein [Deltaproteobacteria bacterium]|nr:TIGR04563 family protein [Deltaproteobacteria bacterium]